MPEINLPTIDEPSIEDILVIDIGELDRSSREDARRMVHNITDLFYDEEFAQRHPRAYRCIEMEVETLRGLIKMRKADEEAHDALLSAIGENKSNASLYRSMAEIQRTSIALTGKIHDTIDRLNKLCSELTSHIEMESNEEDDKEGEQTSNIHRGTKEFIKDMVGVG